MIQRPKKIKHLPQWMCIHGHEGAWNDETGNGYHGGLQFDRPFEEAYGKDMLRKYGGMDAGHWTPRDQLIVAERGYEARGFAPWPNTAHACGYI